MEAVIAAVYLDGGWDAADELVLRLLGDRIREGDERPRRARLQDAPPGAGGARPSTSCRATSCEPTVPITRSASSRRSRCTASRTARAKVDRRSRPSRQRRARPGSDSRTNPRLRCNGVEPTGEPPMPELPEVEVVRRDLERELIGKRVKAVEVDGMRTVRRHHNRKQFISRLEGKKFTGVERRGKYILCRTRGWRRARDPSRDVGSAAPGEDAARDEARSTPT